MRQTCLLNWCSCSWNIFIQLRAGRMKRGKNSVHLHQPSETCSVGMFTFLEQSRPSAELLSSIYNLSGWSHQPQEPSGTKKSSQCLLWVFLAKQQLLTRFRQCVLTSFLSNSYQDITYLDGKFPNEQTFKQTVPQKQKIQQKKRWLTTKPWVYVYCVSRPSALGRERSFMCYLLALGRTSWPSFCNKTCMSPCWTPSSPTEF